ncbi:hypothetical protein Tco_0259905 [Tanacetum coccineum]
MLNSLRSVRQRGCHAPTDSRSVREAAGTAEEQAKNFRWGLHKSILDHVMCIQFTDVAQSGDDICRTLSRIIIGVHDQTNDRRDLDRQGGGGILLLDWEQRKEGPSKVTGYPLRAGIFSRDDCKKDMLLFAEFQDVIYGELPEYLLFAMLEFNFELIRPGAEPILKSSLCMAPIEYKIFHEFLEKFVHSVIDDILVFSKSNEVAFMGQFVSAEGYYYGSRRRLSYPPNGQDRRAVTKVQSFLGLAGYTTADSIEGFSH